MFFHRNNHLGAVCDSKTIFSRISSQSAEHPRRHRAGGTLFKGPVALTCTWFHHYPEHFFQCPKLNMKSNPKKITRVLYLCKFSRRFEWRYFQIDPSSISHRKMVREPWKPLWKWSRNEVFHQLGPLLKRGSRLPCNFSMGNNARNDLKIATFEPQWKNCPYIRPLCSGLRWIY